LPQGFCGDGVIQAFRGEQCDDANTNDYDACRNNCQLNVCGDGFQNVGVEACDDGNTDNTDCCTNACTLATCGDGFVQNCQPNLLRSPIGAEACDDGNTDNLDGCLNNCELNVCGDGFRNVGVEQCDDANTDNTDCCTDVCNDAACGDGFAQACNNEECDDANTNDTDTCSNTCRLVVPGSTTTSTLPPTTTTVPATGACCVAGDCFVGTPGQCEVGTYQGDGTSCQTPGICSTCGNGLIESGEECDDANTAVGDGCDGKCAVEQCWNCVANAAPTTTAPVLPGPSICTHDDGVSCDDGDICTVGDTCSAGTCGGNAVVIPAACNWVMTGDANVQSRTRGHTQVTGHVCGGRTRLGEYSTTNGDAVATVAAGVGIQISAGAAVAGDIVTGGSSVSGKPRLTLLPGLAVDVLPGGTTAVQSGNPEAEYDTLGTNVRVDDCAAAQSGVSAGDSLLSLLPNGPDLGDTSIAAGASLTLTATNPGGLNVFDFRTLRSATDGTLTLDGAGNAGSVFVLRVERKIDLRLRSKLVLSNGTVAGNVIVYGQAKCRFGEDLVGAGTVFCPKGKLSLRERALWQGALVGGRGRVELRDRGVLIHVPLQVAP